MKKRPNKNYRLQVTVITALIIVINLGFVSITWPRSEIGHTKYVVSLGMKKIAILPFSNRSHQVFSAALTWKGSNDIVAYIKDYFEARQIPVVSGQPVEKLLLSDKIIRVFKNQNNPISREWNVIHSNYSLMLSKEILKSIFTNCPATTKLSKGKVKGLAREFGGVDAFIRGVILDATPKSLIDNRTIMEREIPDPFGGILPFQIEGLACYSMADRYEQSLPSLKKIRRTALEFSNKIEKTIEVIIFIQNTKNGSVVWSNSFRMAHPAICEDFDAILSSKISLVLDELFSVLYYHKGLWLLVAEKEDNL
ncbi:MAG: hypothetical protein U9R31_03320 [Candidatus Omnitrophota bacterium]|nr:hypothetical protein [Candidatus Omnitrophota bacterium]